MVVILRYTNRISKVGEAKFSVVHLLLVDWHARLSVPQLTRCIFFLPSMRRLPTTVVH